MPCSLCNCETRKFQTVKEREYLQCVSCRAILLSPKFYLSPQAEKFRYSLHNNDVNDPGYIHFVSPIVKRIRADFDRNSSGLDFGCGTGPVITTELRKSGYTLELYDPFFNPNRSALKKKFDFIVCCEVMEHFKNPLQEFKLLRSLLKEHGKLYCKTEVWKESVEFQDWHYKNDLTHVFFYNRKTLEWISHNLDYSGVAILKDFIVFSA
ncbi:class I SAM-dependent methyltransferase [Christiangramia sabulilitoris]|uniref:Class I SAM-dependent methyltransferase n=1 Tax=Christiangramia sabulilitoris TaxID=2583991 RepID=A0A550I7F4_9FLAO|nr:class I SAM-dependent methyltransferase [Christiangramia sabulilitoris]TRO66906.1 class I SAM-dependent methyltransferase [Christiangramia sabulilitoris]